MERPGLFQPGNGGLRHEVPDVVSGQEVPDREVTAPCRPDPRSRQKGGAWPDESLRWEV